MKKAIALSSLFIFGGLGSLSYLASQVLHLNLYFDLEDEDASHHC